MILFVWFGIAGAALLLAMVALFYGVPDRNQPQLADMSRAAVDGMTTGSLRSPSTPSIGVAAGALMDGRSDMGVEDNGPAELARLKVENVALRQAIEQLRTQLDLMADRLSAVEGRFDDVTGSISSNAPQPRFSEADIAAARGVPAGNQPVAGFDANATVVPQTQFGVEIGTFGDLTSVRAAWRSMLNDHPALFDGLQALATVRDRNGKTELLLVAGPFRNAADAATHCGKVEAAGVQCLPAFYLGQPL